MSNTSVIGNILIVECICSGSFFVTEKKLRSNLVGIHICGQLYTDKNDGQRKICTRKYSYISLLKILQITDLWHADDEETMVHAEDVKI